MKQTTKSRLERGFQILMLIDDRRRTSGDKALGSSIENAIVGRELKELEADWQPELVPVRVRQSSVSEPRP